MSTATDANFYRTLSIVFGTITVGFFVMIAIARSIAY